MPFVDRLSLFRRSAPVTYRSKYDSCLDQIDENIRYSAGGTNSAKHSIKNTKRRSTTLSSSPSYSPKSLMDISKPNISGSKKFLSFIHKGFHGSKSKSMSKMDQQDFLKIAIDRKNLDALNGIIPIPIRETAIQSHSKTLFHKTPQSNVRAKPLLKLNVDTKFIPIHSSLLSKKFNYCVKIISLFPFDFRKCSSGNKYELLLPTGTHSLGHTCHVDCSDKLQVQCPSCHSSHLSLCGIDKQLNHMTGYLFSCSSEGERRKWLNVLTRLARPNVRNERRREISLNIWIQEAKNVLLKKRYFCEIYLDETLHARTTTKTMTNMLFWGEEFHLSNLEEVRTVTIVMWKATTNDTKMKKKKSHQQLICQITICTADIEQRNSIEKWYSASCNFTAVPAVTSSSIASQNSISLIKTSENPQFESIQIPSLGHSTIPSVTSDQIPMIRIKARYQNLDILPINDYSKLIEFLKKNAVHILLEMESYLKVKNKEELAENLLNVIHQQGMAVEFLCDLIFHEITISEDQNMILRSNTMASKAIEVYLKLIGEKYLNLTLSDFVNRVLQGDDDCEVDPQKDKYDFYNSLPSNGGHSSSTGERSNPQYSLLQRQESLLMNVDMVWAKIMSSSIYFPRSLKSVFIALRRRLENSSKNSINKSNTEPNLCDRIISSCIFLRYICPAILTPSLFGLIPEYPDNPKVTRTFTLVAKCIQTLANFSDLTGCKESYMVFMNNFIENKFVTMHSFLEEISTESDKDVSNPNVDPASALAETDNQNCLYWENLSNSLSEETIDISLCLARLHRQLGDCLTLIPAQKFSGIMEILYGIVDEINVKLRVKQSSPPHSNMKYSQSYQDMKGSHKTHLDSGTEYFDSSYFRSGTLTKTGNNSAKHGMICHPTKTKKISSGNSKPAFMKSSNSLYQDAVSLNQLPLDNNPSSGSHLMTQSLIEDNLKCSVPNKTISREQVDKEWKEMVSESNDYAKPLEIQINPDNKHRNLVFYQTIGRSVNNACMQGDHNNNNIGNPPSPSSTVKRCKQNPRHFDPVSPIYSFDSDSIYRSKQLSKFIDVTRRRNSTDHPKSDLVENSLLSQREFIDSCSTETITSCTEQKTKRCNQVQPTRLVNPSVSMPSFNLSNLPHECCSGLRNDFMGMRGQRKDDHELPNQRTPPYNAIGDEINDVAERNFSPVDFNEITVKHMVHSLDQLHHTLNARMTQLLLADNTTIQLELERVRLMKHIYGTSSQQTFDSLLNFQWNTRPNGRFIPPNGSIVVSNKRFHDSITSTKLSVKRYLEVAEEVLTEAQHHHPKEENDKQTEDLIIHILETNQSLQNSLVNKLECYISKSEKNSSAPVTNPNTNSKCQIKDFPNDKRSENNESAIVNENSTERSVNGYSSTTMIELIDAV